MDTESSGPRITGFRKFPAVGRRCLPDPLKRRTGPPDALGMHGLPDWAWPTIQVLGFAALGIAHLTVGGPAPPGWTAIGALVASVGVGLAVWALVVLDTVTWMPTPTRPEPATTGPYRRVRHPEYLGQVLLGVGSAILWPSWAAWAAVVVIALGFVGRALVEERRMVDVFGAAAVAYHGEVRWRFLPPVF